MDTTQKPGFISSFTSYEKIAETVDQWQLDETGYRLLEKVSWVVTEKIHGANFCFITDGQTILCANRKHILHKNDDFFHYHVLLDRLHDEILHAFSITQESHPQIARLFIYGELFGGAYHHVPSDPSVQPVQTGIYYSPRIEFCAFDLAIESTDQTRMYVDYDRAIEICKTAGLFYAIPLFIGSYREALEYRVGFASTIPALLGLPPLQEDNKAEGIVIKPLKTLFVPTRKGLLRPVLKKKIAEFAEDKRFDQAQKWPNQHIDSLPENLEILKWEAFNQVTENRLRNAISKVGLPERGQQRKASQIFRLLVEDILEYLTENQSQAFNTITPDEKRQLLTYIQEETRSLMKSFFQ